MANKTEQQTPEQELPPNIKYITEAQIIYDNERYRVRELLFPDITGKTLWTMTICTLRPSQQTRGHSHPELSELFTFLRGDGIAMIKDKAVFCKPPMCISVEPETWIKIINVSSSTDLVYHTYVNGRIKRPDVARKN